MFFSPSLEPDAISVVNHAIVKSVLAGSFMHAQRKYAEFGLLDLISIQDCPWDVSVYNVTHTQIGGVSQPRTGDKKKHYKVGAWGPFNWGYQVGALRFRPERRCARRTP